MMPATESRVKKSLLNARVNLIFYFLTLALSFFSRKIFLDTLGSDFVGLTGTLQNLLGFLNLAELGIGSAIGYVLYQPLYEHDEAKINEIISVFGYLYRWIGFIILGVGGLLACFLPLIFPHTGFDLGIIYFAYGSFLASSLIGYFANYKQTLLGADQKNYVVTAYFQTASIVKTLIQMASAYYTGNYYLWVAIELIFGVIYSFILNWKVNQVYPWLRSEVGQGKRLFEKYPEVMKYTKQLFVHRINDLIQYQTTPFLIYTFVALQTVAYYGNYTIITDKLTQLMNSVLGSTEAGIGNLIAEGNREKAHQIFWELIAIRFLCASVFTFGIYYLMDPFITVWIGKVYALEHSVLIMILCSLFIRVTQGSIGQFLYGYGLFRDTWAPVTQSAIYIIGALVGGYYWGLPGILSGGVVSILVIMLGWKPYFLYKSGFRMPIFRYWKNWMRYMLIVAASFVLSTHLLSYITFDPTTSYTTWILYACTIMPIYTLIVFSLLFIGTQGMRNAVSRIMPRKK